MITAIAIIVTIGFVSILGLLGFSYMKHRKDVVEKENHFRDYYK